MVVVAAGRDEHGLVAVALRDVEAEDVAIEGKRPVDVRRGGMPKVSASRPA
jgi:phenylpyruvate tautomerase PptA (4-oxalocrotonate tautomerase family)